MSSRSKKWVILLFLMSLLLSLAVNIPIRQVLRYVQIPDKIQLQGLNGSFIKASIDRVSYQGYELTGVDIELAPVCLLHLSVCYGIKSDDYELDALVNAGVLTQSLSLKESKVVFDESIFDSNTQLLVKPKGEFAISIEDVTFQDEYFSNIKLTVNWVDAGIKGEKQILGNYIADVTSEESGLLINLKDQDSLLSATGSISLNGKGEYSTKISLGSKQGLNPSIKNAIGLFAKQNGLDRYTFNKKGKLPANSSGFLKHLKTEGSGA